MADQREQEPQIAEDDPNVDEVGASELLHGPAAEAVFLLEILRMGS